MNNIADNFSENARILVVGILLFISGTMFRIIAKISEIFQIDIPFRVMIGFNIFFVFILPAVLVWVGFQNTSPVLSFAVPFITVGVLEAIADAILLGHIDLLLYPPFQTSSLRVGTVFAIMGVGASQYRSRKVIAVLLVIIAWIILFSNTPNLVVYSIYVLFGTGLEYLV